MSMQFETEYRSGLDRGVERCRDTMPATDAQVETASQRARALLENPRVTQLTNGWHPRSIVLFDELVTVGTFARVVNSEPALTISDLRELSEWLRKILNSFLHE